HEAAADATPLMRRLGVHPLHFADAAAVPFQRATGDGGPIFAHHEHGGGRLGHLLDGEVMTGLARGERQQRLVQLGDEAAHLVGQRAFDGDGDGHGYSTTFGTTKKLSSDCGALATMAAASPPAVTTSSRILSFCATTLVIGSTPSTFTSCSCS